ncbi:aminotransferase class I/II-fold pyridoxal phosphate-dependent enzyme [Burkholderia sp. GS2Y]|uniref:Aminotransferase class I/II-fold pyridoxal phosphate-dependent enzyme n=1 Tax=Burkholderia theae TaxID=3143496 RepID=A0ABU9WE77_9BURK
MEQRNRHTNLQKVVARSHGEWDDAQRIGLAGINATVSGRNRLHDAQGRQFAHFCTTSYLGLDYDERILEGAMNALRATRTLRIANSRNRCKLAILDRYEQALGAHFGATASVALSCSAASTGMLPLMAAGLLSDGVRPVMAFDRFAHYSMNHAKPACADETDVLTIAHNDLDHLESLCRQHRQVAYIADSFYSMGGVSPVADVIALQQKYGMLVYYDDSHALSAIGPLGRGLVHAVLGELPERVFVVASLAKAFGASGGVLLYRDAGTRNLIDRYGGPANWSQSLNAAAIGAGLASLDIHQSPELPALQARLQHNLRRFDNALATAQHGSASPIRLLRCGDAEFANRMAATLLERGFLTSPVFFPVVPQDSPAVRVTLRADMTDDELDAFCASVDALAPICA